jgi:hypothetical protein
MRGRGGEEVKDARPHKETWENKQEDYQGKTRKEQQRLPSLLLAS